jgi:glycosyltransferase involved in cell wall biosynthesis
MRKPDISIVVCTYRRPDNLRRVLASIAGQQDVDGRFEVVVADDGSDDDTQKVVDEFRRTARFAVHFVTHKHEGFCPGRCRNEGVAAAQADYILLLDGDCIIPPDHLKIHLEKRQPGVVWLGDHARLDERESAAICAERAFSGAFPARTSSLVALRMRRKALKTSWYKLSGNSTKPRLTSNNVGIWRDDYLRVNGFDENYVGWGCEDDDMGLRLRRANLRLESILWWTWAYHLWHPPVNSMPTRWKEGPNVVYFSRGFHLVRCGNGVEKRMPQELRFKLRGERPSTRLMQQVLPDWCNLKVPGAQDDPEVEILFAPSRQGFSGNAQCNLLVMPDSQTTFSSHYARANLVLADNLWPQVKPEHQFGLHEFEKAMFFLLHNTSSISAARLKRNAAQVRRLASENVLALRPAG